jgi:glutamate racemase
MTPKNKNPIGMFDSGLGGLSVWKSVVKMLPNESIIYVGDHKYLPYGNLSGEEIRARAIKIISKLVRLKCKLIVIACNTATVAGIDIYRRNFPDIPIIGIVPVVKTAAAGTKTKHIAILATAYTAKSAYHQELLRKYTANITVENIGCPNLVSLIEKGIVSGKHINAELSEILAPVSGTDIDVIALGCSHYPFIARIIKNHVGKNVMIMDSGAAVARHAKRILMHNEIINTVSAPVYRFYTSGNQKEVSHVAERLIKKQVFFENLTI